MSTPGPDSPHYDRDPRVLLCRAQPGPGALFHNPPCSECGHLLALHAGCDVCPVCELGLALAGLGQVAATVRSLESRVARLEGGDGIRMI